LWFTFTGAVATLVVGLTAGVNSQRQEVPAGPAGGGPVPVGGGQGRGRAGENPAADFSPKPPYLPRSAAEQAKTFRLPPGYRLELVLSDPDIISPVTVEFDGNGRMYVIEMISYMLDAEATREHDPISRISRWESTKGDGVFDKHTIFADKMVAPRMVLPLTDGVILTSETDSDELVKLSDTNGDGVADKREVVFTGIGQSGDANIEHQKAGLMWGLDNWIYTTYNAFRIRWTPNGFLREPTGSNGGQWGLGMDDDGKPWFVDAGGERGPMNFQYPIHYGGFTPCAAGRGFGRAGAAPPARNPNCPAGMDDGFETDFAVVWPPPGIGDMQGGLFRTRMPAQNLNHFTAATGPAIVRGDRLPADLKGDLLFTEPVGRLIRRAKIENVEGLTMLRNAYPQAEFITSEDQLFRPVNISNAPDGTVFIVDMYHGIIQERQWSGAGTYLRAKIEQYQLDKVVSHGRIWRLRYDGRPEVPTTPTNPGHAAISAIQPDFTTPRVYGETSSQLVVRLSHPNGWYRDTAQRLLIVKQDKTVVPALQQIVRSGDANLLGRFHALWTLEGLGALDVWLVREAMKDSSPRLRVQAIRASETLFKSGTKTLADDYQAMTKDTDTNVAIQAMLTLNLFKIPNAADAIKATQSANPARGVQLIGTHLLAVPAANPGGAGRGMALSAEEQTLLQQGADVFNSLCSSCHGADGRGQALAGATVRDAMMAPPLNGSPRIRGHRDYVINVLLHGLTGPLDNTTYSEVMVPMGANSDAWVAGVASYIRTSFGNAAGLVTPADVARVRTETARRKTMWTIAELQSGLPRAVASEKWTLSASHNTESVTTALTLRGWTTGTTQSPGMWFQVELAEPAMVSEIEFVSPAGRGGGGRGAAGRGGPGAAAGPGPPPVAVPPAFGFPRGYTVTLSMDGKIWSKPVATGKGTGARTSITFAAARARFIRLTQTDAVADAPAWSITNLRVYERPVAAK
jgi:mono/diheme cytochrome c family protein/glucose/arabinose dehydrogenase